MMHGYDWNGATGWGWIGMTVMMVFWFALLALIIYAVARAFWHPTRSNMGSNHEDQAMNVLRERYARGEITEEEYRQVSSTLHDTAR